MIRKLTTLFSLLFIYGCVTKSRNQVKGPQSISEIKSDQKLHQYLQKNGVSENQYPKMLSLLEQVRNLEESDSSLNLTEVEGGEKVWLVCGKLQLAIIAKGGGAMCHEWGGNKVRYVTIFGVGLAGGLATGVFFVSYKDFDENIQTYEGIEWGVKLLFGVEGMKGTNENFGNMSLFGFVFDTGLPIEVSSTTIKIKKFSS